MRQRMAAIETIYKITHAMQLISMSSHTKLRNKKGALIQYETELARLFNALHTHAPTWHHPILLPRVKSEETESTSSYTLIILVGSQKGLCGTFNQHLFSFFERQLTSEAQKNAHFISIGKRACDYLDQKTEIHILKQYPEFTHNMIATISQEITHQILHTKPHYASVIVYSNWSKTFFAQEPAQHTIIPLLPPGKQETEYAHDYEWEQSPDTLLTALAQSLLQINIQDLLLTSLTAEQAARFVAMDNATRNALNLFDDMKLEYNKRRQAKITRELTDLIGSL